MNMLRKKGFNLLSIFGLLLLVFGCIQPPPALPMETVPLVSPPTIETNTTTIISSPEILPIEPVTLDSERAVLGQLQRILEN